MANENIIPDGNSDFSAGQDSSRSADKVVENGYYAAINTTSKNGSLGPRWGVEKKRLKFPSGGIGQRTWENIFGSGKFQAFVPVEFGNDRYLITIVNGIIFLVNKITFEVRVLVLEGQQIAPNLNRINWTYADQYVEFFDYPNYPVLVQSIEARRANPKNQETPVSRLGAMNSNRTFIVNGKNEFTGSDPIGSVAAPDAPITFKEVTTVGSDFFGQIFKIPTNYQDQKVTAMSFLQVADTSTGIGPLLVSTKNMMASYPVGDPRSQWTTKQFGSVLLYNTGMSGQRAQENVNSNLYFISGDGKVRSLAMSRDQQQRFSRVPLSREVEKWLKYSDIDLAEYASMVYFENKLLITANPFLTPAYDNAGNRTFDIGFSGMVVLEFDNVTSFGDSGKPAWAGLWTGIRPMDFAKSGEELFIISKDRESLNAIYQMHPDKTYDYIDGKVQYIKSRIYTREYVFKAAQSEKELNSIEIGLENVAGNLDLTIAYKASHASAFTFWKHFKHKVAWKWGKLSDILFNGYATQSFKGLNFGAPKAEYDQVTKEPLNVFKRMALRIDISAKNWEINLIKLNAKILPNVTNNNTVEKAEVTKRELTCNEDWNLEERVCSQIT